MNSSKSRHSPLRTTLIALCLLPAAGILAQQAPSPHSPVEAPAASQAQSLVPSPWDGAPFSLPSAEVLKDAASGAPRESDGVYIAYESCRYEFAADGGLSQEYRIVYRILSDDGLKRWGDVSASWSPWHMDRPRISARVTNPDGSSWDLAESDFHELAPESQDLLYSDQRSLKAPLPRAAVGSVVEERILSSSRPLLPGAGIQRRWAFGSYYPIGASKVLVRLAPGLPFSWNLSRDGGIARSESGSPDGYREYRFEQAAPGATYREGEPLAKPSESDERVLDFSTSPSWTVLAGLYAAAVEGVMAGDDPSLPAGFSASGLSARDAATSLMHAMETSVRYTGLELGVNSIIPSKGSASLSRGYGDCKDKAVLLAEYLRKLGFKAWVALVLTGPGRDVDPAVPGLDDFDHAIVCFQGADGLEWADPTNEFNRLGRIPSWDEERNALVARSGEASTTQTPRSDSASNRVLESREYRMADYGKGSVSETSEYYGAWDGYYRDRYAGEDPTKTQKRFADYAASSYGATLTDFTVRKTKDYSAPFGFTLKMAGINASYTDEDGAAWSFDMGFFKDWIPDSFLDEPKEARTKTFRYQVPFSVDMEATVIPPEGFSPVSLPPPAAFQWGPMTMSLSYAQSGEAVRVSAKLDAGKAEYSAAEFDEAGKAIRAYYKGSPRLSLSFVHRGTLLLKAERYGEAFDLYRSLAAEHPDKAIHLVRLSSALLAAGLGTEARRTAEKATSLEPGSAVAWAALAKAREQDPLGRRFVSGWDREGAIAAWRKAIALEPEEWTHKANLAILLEHDERGFRWTDPAALGQASELYAQTWEEMKDGNLAGNLANCLFRLGSYDKAIARAGEIGVAATRNLWLLAARTAKGGAAAGIAAMDPGLSREERSAALAGAADELIDLRRYADAVSLLREAARGAADGTAIDSRADNVAKMKAWSASDLGKSPEELLKRLVLQSLTFDGKAAPAGLEALASPALAARLADPAKSGGLSSCRDEIDLNALKNDEPTALWADIELSFMQTVVDGDDSSGWRIQLSDGPSSFAPEWYALPGKDGPVLVATSASPDLMGKAIIDLLARGKADAAAQWLDWAYALNSEDSSNLVATSLASLWSDSGDRGAAAMTLAAAGLIAMGPASPADFQALLAARSGAMGDRLDALDILLSEAYRSLSKYDDSLAFINSYLSRHASSRQGRSIKALTLFRAGRMGEGEPILRQLLKENPRDAQSLDLLINDCVNELDFAKLDKILADYKPKLSAALYNNIAWMDAFREGSPTDRALEYARKSVSLTNSRASYNLHTLATLYALSGRYDDSRKALGQSMALSPDEAPKSEDWFVLGRLAEGYGFPLTAREAYSKVQKADDPVGAKVDTWVLAQAGLARLGAAERK